MGVTLCNHLEFPATADAGSIMAELHRSAQLLPMQRISPLVHLDEEGCRSQWQDSFYDKEAATWRRVYPLESFRFFVVPDEGCEGIDVKLERFPEWVEVDGRRIAVPYKGWVGGGCGKIGHRNGDGIIPPLMMCALIDRALELGAIKASGEMDEEPPGFMVTRYLNDLMFRPPAVPTPLRGFEACREAVRVFAEQALQDPKLPDTARTRYEAFLKG